MLPSWQVAAENDKEGDIRMRQAIAAAVLLLSSTALVSGCDRIKRAAQPAAEVKDSAYPDKVLWGDTHLHTANSVDAFGFGNRLDPEAALRFASGEEVTSSTGIKEIGRASCRERVCTLV